jgi:hypothetical protein
MRLLFIALLLIGCAKNASETAETTDCTGSELVGEWQGEILGQPDTMKIYSSCRVTSTYCDSIGAISITDDSSATVNVTDALNPVNTGCLPIDQSVICGYVISDGYLFFNCGNDSLTYQFMGAL